MLQSVKSVKETLLREMLSHLNMMRGLFVYLPWPVRKPSEKEKLINWNTPKLAAWNLIQKICACSRKKEYLEHHMSLLHKTFRLCSAYLYMRISYFYDEKYSKSTTAANKTRKECWQKIWPLQKQNICTHFVIAIKGFPAHKLEYSKFKCFCI